MKKASVSVIERKKMDLILCLVNTLCLVCGQLLFKLGTKGKSLLSFKDIVGVLFSPTIILALVLYAGTTLLWMYILSRIEISYAYPIQALAFPLVMIISSIAFQENIPINRWVGIAIVLIGLYVIVRK